MTILSPAPKLQFFSANGDPLVGGKLYSYQAGTTTPLNTYTSQTGGSANTNPIILDARGEANVWLTANIAYKLKLTDANDVEVWTVDNISNQDALVLLAASNGSSLVGYLPGGTSAVATTVQAKLRQTVSVKDFGAVGDGVANDTLAIQAAVDSVAATGGVVIFPPGDYLIARNIGVNDRWGVKVTASNTTLCGDQATLKRYNTNISTYALAYPIVLVGTPDNDSAAATDTVTIEGFHFIGENTQHSIGGNVIHDFRNAIEAKNTTNLTVQNNKFTDVDSAVIYFQRPYELAPANSVWYNTTKNYDAKFINNSCIAPALAAPRLGLIHAVVWSGVDFCTVDNNFFEWCDDCVAGEGTYDYPGDTENVLWDPVSIDPAWTLGSVKRSGRSWSFSNNTVYNSCEHAVYAAGLDVTINGNRFYTDAPAICEQIVVKLRARNVTCNSNVFSNYACAILADVPSYNVNVTGNTIWASEPTAALIGSPVLGIQSFDLASYYPPRPWFVYTDTMRNFNFTGNNIFFPAPTATAGLYQIAFRIYTDASSVTFPVQVLNVNFSENTICDYYIGIYIVNTLMRNITISNNVFNAKSFIEAGFNGSTVMDTYAPLVIFDSSTLVGQQITFNNNQVYGAKFLFSTFTGGGTNVRIPWIASVNKLDYIQDFKSSDMVSSSPQSFNNNTGIYFLDRTTWFPEGINNSLNDGSNANSALKSMIVYNGANVIYYNNDAGGTITLG